MKNTIRLAVSVSLMLIVAACAPPAPRVVSASEQRLNGTWVAGILVNDVWMPSGSQATGPRETVTFDFAAGTFAVNALAPVDITVQADDSNGTVIEPPSGKTFTAQLQPGGDTMKLTGPNGAAILFRRAE